MVCVTYVALALVARAGGGPCLTVCADVPGRGACLDVPEMTDVFLQFPAQQLLTCRVRCRLFTNEVFSGAKDVASLLCEADVGAPAVPGRFFLQESQALKAPQNLAHALPAHAEQLREIRNCCGFQFRRCLQGVQ